MEKVKRVVQLDLPIEDAFAWAILVETAISCVLGTVAAGFLLSWPFLRVMTRARIWASILPLILIVKSLVFVVLVWIGFVKNGKSIALKCWVILGILQEIVVHTLYILGILISSILGNSSPEKLVVFILSLPFFLIFRGMIYTICWTMERTFVQSSESDEDRFPAYGKGILNFFQYYRRQSVARTAGILLIAIIIWNLWSILAYELSPDYNFVRQFKEGPTEQSWMGITPLKIARILFALLFLWVVKSGKMKCLKSVCLPSQFTLLVFGVLWPFFELIVCRYRDPNCSYAILKPIILLTELFINFVLDALLICVLFKGTDPVQGQSESEPE